MVKYKGMRIIGIEPGSIGEELNIKPGDELVSLCGYPVTDILDYEFYNSGEKLVLGVSRDGRITEFEIEKYADEDLGLSFDSEIPIRVCKNKCVFCFVDQLPKGGMRSTLKVKDDDYRHSFLSGNYVTLTNVTDEDMERILRLKLSPLYISVHSSDDGVRRKMLGNKYAPSILGQLSRLKSGGIRTHAQIVYCPGLNEDTDATIKALSGLCESLAVVPVGLTKFYNTDLTPVSERDARRIISIVETNQRRLFKEKGTRFVFAADELYLKAGLDCPPYETYENFPQIENGVGLVASFVRELNEELFEILRSGKRFAPEKLCSVTGVSAYPVIKNSADKIAKTFGVDITVYPIENRFFGSEVTVAGLVTGGDIIEQIKDKPKGERLIVPRCMLKEFGDVFLDNVSVSRLSSELNVPVSVCGVGGADFLRCALKIGEENI